MDEDKRREPRLISAERDALVAVNDRAGDSDAGNYITQLANAWAAARKKSVEQQ